MGDREPARPCEILIINQHGNNRGDEAALRAMLKGLAQRLERPRFTVLHQFRERRLPLAFDLPVEDLPLILSPLEAAGLTLFAALRYLGLKAGILLGPRARAIVSAYERADLVVSAPGGPYFGDLYWGHELVHWFYVALAALHAKPLFLYAPSAGPFRIRWLNPIRRALYRRFEVLCVREDISAGHLRELLGRDAKVVVTADSALQSPIPAATRSDFFRGERMPLAERFVVAVSLVDFGYPEAPDPERRRAEYERAVLAGLRHLARRRPTHFLFFPQLYGREPTDLPYLERLVPRIGEDLSCEIVDPLLDSDGQQALFAMADLFIASRYHPAIFGCAALVPGVCIYYEHKALGFMTQLGLERFALDIRTLSQESLLAALDALLDQHAPVVGELKTAVPKLRARACLTSELAVEVLRRDRSRSGSPS